MFSKIITVTLNPSIDVTLWIDKIDLDEPVKSEKEKEYPGGKGLNVSRVLTSLGIDNTAIAINGNANGEKLLYLLKQENVVCDFIDNDQPVRENYSIVLPDKKMLKINRKGFFVSQQVLDELKQKIKSNINGVNSPLIIFAGSLPQNVTKEQYKALVLEFKNEGAIVALDNDIFSIEDIKDISPYLIKPNCVEIAHMFGLDEIAQSEIPVYAKKLSEYCDHVLVSLGAEGLLYCSKNKQIKAIVPKIEVKSTIGAGDTTLAGFVAALDDDEPIECALRFAASCGTASVCLDGTDVISKAQAQSIYNQVKTIYS